MIRLFRVFIPVSTFTLFLAEILLTGLCFVAGAYLVFDVDPTDYLLYDGGALAILVVTVIILLGFYFNGLYSAVYVKSRIILLYQLFLVIGMTFLVEGLISSFAVQLRVPIRVMIAGSSLSVAVIFGWRLFFNRYAMEILGNARVLLVGTDPVLEAVERYVASHPQSGFRVAGYVHEDGAHSEPLPGIKHLGGTGELTQIIHATGPSRVVVGLRQPATVEFARLLEDLRYAGQNIEEAADTYEKVCGRVWVRGIQPADLIYTSRFGAPIRHQIVQRFTNPVWALLGLIVTFPVMALVWLLLKLHLKGPVLARQERIGLDGKRFLQYRFRLPDPMKRPSRTGALGAVLKFHLDGLPQLVNVLQGEMAFVGPRPERPEYLEPLSEAIPYYPQRNCVRPGMTGWAQIQDGPRVPDTLANVEYDLYYIKYMSMSLDALILFQTIRAMLRDE